MNTPNPGLYLSHAREDHSAAVPRRQTPGRCRADVAVAGLGILTLAAVGLGAWGFDMARTAERQGGLLLAAEGERLAGELRTEAALVVMLEAAALAGKSESQRLEAAFARVLERAARERTYSFPGDAQGFEYRNALYVWTPTDGQLWRIDTREGPVAIATWPGEPLQVVELSGVRELPAAVVLASEGRLFAALADPETGNMGPLLDLMPFDHAVMEAEADIGPDGRGLVNAFVQDEVWREEQEPAINHAAIYTAFDLTAGLTREVGNPERPDVVPELRVLVSGETRLAVGNGELVWLDGNPPLPDPELEGGQANQMARAVDCLARSGDPEAAARFAEPLTRPISDDWYWSHFSLMIAHPYCEAANDRLLHSSLFFTSSGVEVTVALLDQYGGHGAALRPANVAVVTGLQSRPSVLWPWADEGPMAAIAGIAGATILADPVVMSGTPLRVPFAHSVSHVVLTPDLHLVALEGVDYGQVAEERRVTVLAMPELAWNVAEDASDAGVLPPLAEIIAEDGPPRLVLHDSGQIIALPQEFGTFTPMAPVGTTGDVLAAVDNRSVERWSRKADGTWERSLLFVADAHVRDLHAPRDGASVAVVLDHGFGDIEARLWSLADGRAITALGENYKWASFEDLEDGSVRFVEIGMRFRLLPLSEAIGRAEASLPSDCQPAPGAGWRTSPCWPGDVSLPAAIPSSNPGTSH